MSSRNGSSVGRSSRSFGVPTDTAKGSQAKQFFLLGENGEDVMDSRTSSFKSQANPEITQAVNSKTTMSWQRLERGLHPARLIQESSVQRLATCSSTIPSTAPAPRRASKSGSAILDTFEGESSLPTFRR